MSASRAVFTAMIPKRRIISGWLVISCGRSRMRSRKSSICSYIVSRRSSDKVSELPAAKRIRPFIIRSMTEFCITSVNMEKAGRFGSSPSAPSTALAMLPTPDCRGRNSLGMAPFFHSRSRKAATLCPICRVVSFCGVKAAMWSRAFVRTTPVIFFGSIFTLMCPARSFT